MKKVLIFEDDKGIGNSLKIYLENSNFEVFLQEDGLDAIKIMKKNIFDLIILDINLPNKNGIEICKEVRGFSSIPIIMLTARTSEIDKVIGLEIGADDYIAKPFSPRELLARINSILRRSETNNEKKDELNFKNININLKRKTVKVNDIEIQITKNEYDILEKIIKEKGKIVSRERLMKDAIGYEQYIYDRTIDTHIKNLRKKIGDKNIILTVRGEGFRLNN